MPEGLTSEIQRIAAVAAFDRSRAASPSHARFSRPLSVRTLLQQPDLQLDHISHFLYVVGPKKRLNSDIQATRIGVEQLAKACRWNPEFVSVWGTYFSPLWPLMAREGHIERLTIAEKLLFAISRSSVGIQIAWDFCAETHDRNRDSEFQVDWVGATDRGRTWTVLDRLAVLGCLYQAQLLAGRSARASKIAALISALLELEDLFVTLGGELRMFLRLYEARFFSSGLRHGPTASPAVFSDPGLRYWLRYGPDNDEGSAADSALGRVAWLFGSKPEGVGNLRRVADPLLSESLARAWAAGTGTELVPSEYPIFPSVTFNGGTARLIGHAGQFPQGEPHMLLELKIPVGLRSDQQIGSYREAFGIESHNFLNFPWPELERLLRTKKRRRRRATS